MPVLTVRDPNDDESFVLLEFERHASHCSRYSGPLSAYCEGRRLCVRGNQYANSVTNIYTAKTATHTPWLTVAWVRRPWEGTT